MYAHMHMEINLRCFSLELSIPPCPEVYHTVQAVWATSYGSVCLCLSRAGTVSLCYCAQRFNMLVPQALYTLTSSLALKSPFIF